MRKILATVFLVVIGASLTGCNVARRVVYVLDSSYDQNRANYWNPPTCVHETHISVDAGVGVRSDSYYDQYNYGYYNNHNHNHNHD
ncbi:MAG TPA: hypothetical protein VK145_02570 [Candidatus Nanoarchaeia archaeon]|nr:hypothetical protein [Candidatus Nanoarchaeia archaeon]